ncbi:MAG: Flp pilus assembly complex ATPase component TadA [Deltaproteobacteria bacterium]|nr:Flp pilus assembly complex ATPase component TadA [Deltaproteobacteria bacterium]
MATATNTRLTRTGQVKDGSLSVATGHSEEHFNLVTEHLVKHDYLTAKQVEYARRVQSKLEQSRPLLQVIKELKYITGDQIGQALRTHPLSIRIGELLVELGHIAATDLNSALALQAEGKTKRKLGEILVERHLIQEHVLVEGLSLQLGVPFIQPDWGGIDRRLFARVPLKWYETHQLLPIGAKGGAITVAFVDPLDQEELQAARQVFGDRIVTAIACKSAIQEVILKAQRAEMKKQVSALDEQFIVKLVDDIILAAIQREASDVHLEPLKAHLRVRFRQDGVLMHFEDYPPETAPAVASRIKVLCEVDITEKRRHQGGRFFFDHPQGQLDIRASFYVTVHGEKVVLRLLNRHGQLRKIVDLGLSGRIQKRFVEEALDLPSGVLLFTGPTGSGKTTTVYSCLQHITNPQMSIVTAEEPVEYVIDGISQCSINPKIGLTYEETLRHILRQDPDVIVIGEIRDNFSAQVAVQAALTGHKVLTTFHTEDCVGGLIRLLNMSIEAFMISSTVVSVMSQRLLRKVCPLCATPHKPTSQELQRLGYSFKDITGAQFQKGQGCTNCQHSGYKGRVGIYELLILDQLVRDAILDHRPSKELRQISTESAGLITLLEDGINKAAEGVTTIDELLRSLPRLQTPRPMAELRRLI